MSNVVFIKKFAWLPMKVDEHKLIWLQTYWLRRWWTDEMLRLGIDMLFPDDGAIEHNISTAAKILEDV